MLVIAIMPFPHSLRRKKVQATPTRGLQPAAFHSSIHVVVLHRCALGGCDVATCSCRTQIEIEKMRPARSCADSTLTGSVMSDGWG